jgi:hypothetical protein
MTDRELVARLRDEDADTLALHAAADAIERLLADAERYRWLRDKHDSEDDDWYVYGALRYPPNLTADVDEQMAATATTPAHPRTGCCPERTATPLAPGCRTSRSSAG